MTTIATANVDVKVNQDYVQQLNSVHTNIKQFSRKVTAALKPIALGLGGFGGLAIKRALEQNEAASIRWHQSTERINKAMASVGEKILNASFAGKSLFEWMDKFANTLSKMTQGDIQKLVNSFMVINGVLVGLKVLTAGAGLTAAIGKLGGYLGGGKGGGVSRGEFIGGEVASTALGSAFIGSRTSAAINSYKIKNIVSPARWSEMIGTGPEAATRLKFFSQMGYGPASAAAGAGAAGGTAASFIAKSPGLLGWTALGITIAGVLAGMIRTIRGAWDENKGNLSNIGSEFATYASSIGDFFGWMSDAIEFLGRAAARTVAWHTMSGFSSNGSMGFEKIAEGIIQRRTGAIPSDEIAKIQAILDAQDSSYANSSYASGWKRGIKTENGYVPAMASTMTMVLQEQATKLGLRYESLKAATYGKFNEEELRGMTVGDISVTEAKRLALEKYQNENLELQQRHNAILERVFQKRIENEEKLKVFEQNKLNIQEDLDDLEMDYRDTMYNFNESLKENFKGKAVEMGFYGPEASYQAATGWASDLLRYEKEKREFEKDKQIKLNSIRDRLIDIDVNGNKMVRVWEKLEQEAEAYK